MTYQGRHAGPLGGMMATVNEMRECKVAILACLVLALVTAMTMHGRTAPGAFLVLAAIAYGRWWMLHLAARRRDDKA
jgi:hypothetical protein